MYGEYLSVTNGSSSLSPTGEMLPKVESKIKKLKHDMILEGFNCQK
jgi:hypothetical protein